MPPPQDGTGRPFARRPVRPGRARRTDKGRRMAGATCAPARRLLPCPPGRPCPFPGREDMRKNTPRRSPPHRRACLCPALASSPDGESVANGRPDTHTDTAGEHNRSGSLFACPRLLRYRKESRTEAARRPGKESPCSNATTVLKIAPSSCCWPASRWPSSGCCAPSSMSSSGASSSPCSPLPSTMPCNAAAWAATWRR